MKNLCYLFFAFFFMISCASNNLHSENKRKIAAATQRVGEEYYNAGKYTAALKNLLEAQKIIPNDPYLHNSLGLVYLAKQRYDLAENEFKKALDLKADYSQAENNLGAVYLKQEKWNLAIKCFESVCENLLYSTPEIPLSNLGWAYFHQKMFKKAKQYFIQSMEIRPDFLIAVHGIASVYNETGYPSKAIEFLHRALEKNPGAAILHSDLAKAYEALKEFDKAQKAWKNVLKSVPETSSLAKEAQKHLFEMN
ncbi:tetratricopeptide repeat protein [Desulfobacula phenolica]|uniref:Tfp pilus assembly protein PilF n=1 Tax=Desulfobacula phenolica TaxID=90732 RepID=A0A1H2DW97_9BACT|nr:tetratricopeptide repeat protein [Desulfobacula phenolica]SDT87110.1 Tfp pilus assembly protein PilF [Desulfobacula phenolica]